MYRYWLLVVNSIGTLVEWWWPESKPSTLSLSVLYRCGWVGEEMLENLSSRLLGEECGDGRNSNFKSGGHVMFLEEMLLVGYCNRGANLYGI